MEGVALSGGTDADVDSLAILGNILEKFMDLPLPDDPGAREVRMKMRAKVQTALEENGLRYFRFGRVLPQGQIPDAAERQLEQRNSSGPATSQAMSKTFLRCSCAVSDAPCIR